MLELHSVCRLYGGLMAVNDVTFRIEQGSIVGLIGPNGAGKTTLVNLISGMDFVSAGRIIFRKKDITRWPPHKKCAAGIARSFQNIRLFGKMDVIGNVLTGRHLKLPPGARRWKWLFPWYQKSMITQEHNSLHCLRQMSIDHLAERKADTLSYGDQRRVELARALATEPRILLLDEPTAGMNSAETRELGKLIISLKKNGITILVIEHDMNLINQVCDRVVVLNFGSLIAEDTPDAIRCNEKVIQAYLGTDTGE